jgi:hypothetical protein
LIVRCVDRPTNVRDIDDWLIAEREAPELEPPPTGREHSEADERFLNARVEAILELSRREPPIGPSIQTGMELADAIAAHARGVILDPTAQRVVLPGEWRVEDRRYAVDPREHVTVHEVVDDPAGIWMHTHGLAKFGRPELEMFDLPAETSELAYALLMDTSGYVIDGPIVAPGNTLGDTARPLAALEGSRETDHWENRSVIELRGDGGSTAEALEAWAGLT